MQPYKPALGFKSCAKANKTMKTYTIVLCLLIAGLFAKTGMAQQEYLYTTNLEIFEGTWEYQSGSTVFTLVLKKGKQDTGAFFGDCLVGGYRLIKNGQVQADNTYNLPKTVTNETFMPFSDLQRPSFFGDNGCVRWDCVTPNEVDFTFWDRGYGQSVNDYLSGRLTFINPMSIRFEVGAPFGSSLKGPITVPTDVVLTRR